jgi:hypothetical protein
MLYAMRLELLDHKLGITKLRPDAEFPEWLSNAELLSVTRSSDELSIVCDKHCIPDYMDHKGTWVAIKIVGPLDLSATGILDRLIQPLARANISIFVISTYNTDYILIQENHLQAAIMILETDNEFING